MDKDLILAKINAIAVIIAAIISGLLTIVSSIIENNKLKKEYDDLKNKFNVLTNNPKESKDTSYGVDKLILLLFSISN